MGTDDVVVVVFPLVLALANYIAVAMWDTHMLYFRTQSIGSVARRGT